MDATPSARPDVKPPVSAKGALLTLLGAVVGAAGYYWSYTHHTPLGTLVGMVGISLCILGTATSEGPVHR
ncbi:hypothetical protein [Methylobacterium isbiliense]|jgi:hypothetical protein|uniref:Uncharacterized protein n=1 Tax=Methylobacterium isbiliense TaxID=315478 RepID=A0ABQ4SKP1_9HYPH|nr:hypothetical protein [Methylobacterium isbiliense]MDN3627737.1 hypothetical protein [Methylobacterium isbiliense]GJE02881.1 hypothetical protein GMJLKIPL_4830 [Methylobacterium isbiliense]